MLAVRAGPALTTPIQTGKLCARAQEPIRMTSSDATLAEARALLQPEEALVWADRPDPRMLARAKVPQVIRGSLGLAAIAGFFWFSFLPRWPEGAFGALLALFLVGAMLYCLWLMAGPLLAPTQAIRSLYAITDRRVMVLETWPFRRFRSFAPADLDAPLVSPVAPGLGAPGLGTVVFVHRKLPWWWRSAGGGTRIEAFYGIAGAQQVAEEIDRLRGVPEPEHLPEEDA